MGWVFVSAKSFIFDKDLFPSTPGLYSWTYWPDELDAESLCSDHMEFKRVLTIFFENASRLVHKHETNIASKYQVRVYESSLELVSSTFLGLSEARSKALEQYLITSAEHRREVLQIIKYAIFSRPIYIGKANNISKRIQEHYDGVSDFGKAIKSVDDIDAFRHMTIGYKTLKAVDIESDKVAYAIEELLQRILLPKMSIKFG